MYGNYGMPPYFGQPRMQQPMEQPTQQFIQPVQPQIQRTGLQGELVDSIETVKGIKIPLDGSISFYPLVDNSMIVTKQLQNDGTSKITIFKPVIEENDTIKYITPEELEKALNGLDLSELDDIKDEIKELKQEFKEFKKKKKDD